MHTQSEWRAVFNRLTAIANASIRRNGSPEYEVLQFDGVLFAELLKLEAETGEPQTTDVHEAWGKK